MVPSPFFILANISFNEAVVPLKFTTKSLREVRVFSSVGKILSKFYPYTKGFSNGVSLAIGDINQDQRDEILVVPANAASAHVRMFSESGTLVKQFFASGKKIRKGFSISFIK